MTECDANFRDALPDVASGRADAATRTRVLDHVESCAGCAAELRLLGGLYAGRPVLPDRLAERITGAVRADLPGAGRTARRSARRSARFVIPAWALAAAALAGVAIGIPSLVERMGVTAPGSGAGLDALEAVGGLWISEDPMVAGAPVLESLTDEELARLLEEMEG
jgi:anti-sigma factor RsiW